MLRHLVGRVTHRWQRVIDPALDHPRRERGEPSKLNAFPLGQEVDNAFNGSTNDLPAVGFTDARDLGGSLCQLLPADGSGFPA